VVEALVKEKNAQTPVSQSSSVKLLFDGRSDSTQTTLMRRRQLPE
jgi:hypothetical protein